MVYTKFFDVIGQYDWRRGGLVVSTLDSGSKGVQALAGVIVLYS